MLAIGQSILQEQLAALVMPESCLVGVNKFILVYTCGCYCCLPLPNDAVGWSAVQSVIVAFPGQIRLFLFNRFALS